MTNRDLAWSGRKSSLAATLAAAAAAASFVAAASARAPGLGGFAARPATFNPRVPATRAYFIPTIAPGGIFHGQLLASNTRGAPARLLVYPVDGLTGVTSGAVYSGRQDRLRRAGRWLSPVVGTVTLGPHSQRLVGFTVRVPRTATPGDHLAGIALEAAPSPRSGGRFGVIEVLRVVIGVEIRVPGPASPRVALRSLTLAPLPGTMVPSVVIGLGNVGRLTCKPRLSVSMVRQGRRRAVVRSLDTVLPGDTIPYPLPWRQSLPPGAYRVAATATNCGPRATLARVVHLGRALGGANHTPAQRGVRTVLPWWLVALVGALVAALLAILAVLARTRTAQRRLEAVTASQREPAGR